MVEKNGDGNLEISPRVLVLVVAAALGIGGGGGFFGTRAAAGQADAVTMTRIAVLEEKAKTLDLGLARIERKLDRLLERQEKP